MDIKPSNDQDSEGSGHAPGEVFHPNTDSPPAATAAPVAEPPTKTDNTTSTTPPAPPTDEELNGPEPVSSDLTPPPGVPVTPVTTAPKPKRGRGKLIAIIILALLLLAAIAAVVYLYLLAPKQALGKYLQKVSKNKTATYETELLLNSELSGDNPVNITGGESAAAAQAVKVSADIKGAYDLSDTKNPKFSAHLTGNLEADQKSEVDLEVVKPDRDFYAKANKADFLKNLGIDLGQDWYKFEASQTESGGEVACSDEDYNKLRSYYENQVFKNLPIKDAKRVNVLPENVDGHRVAHYSGKLDQHKLSDLLKESEKQVSDKCQQELNIDDQSETTVKDTEISYDIWRSRNFDRIKLVINNSKSKTHSEITLSTKDYKQPVKLEAPANAKSAADLVNKILSGAVSQPGILPGEDTGQDELPTPEQTGEPEQGPEDVTPEDPAAPPVIQ